MIFEFPTIDILNKEFNLKDRSINKKDLEIFSYQGADELKDSCLLLDKTDINLNLNGNDLWGIDLPVRISNGKFNKTIVLLGQDPLRNSKDYPDIKNKIVVSLPFAVNYNGRKLREETKKLIEYICDRGDSIYFTDIFKIYTGENLNNKDFKEVKDLNVSIIKQELEMIKPDIIIASGNIAKKFVDKENISKKYKIIRIPHYTAGPLRTKRAFESLPGFSKDPNIEFHVKKFEYLKEQIEKEESLSS